MRLSAHSPGQAPATKITSDPHVRQSMRSLSFLGSELLRRSPSGHCGPRGFDQLIQIPLATTGQDFVSNCISQTQNGGKILRFTPDCVAKLDWWQLANKNRQHLNWASEFLNQHCELALILF